MGQSWNRYSYVLNNPLRYTDPLGLYVWDGSLGGDTTDDEVRKNYAKKQAQNAPGQRETPGLSSAFDQLYPQIVDFIPHDPKAAVAKRPIQDKFGR